MLPNRHELLAQFANSTFIPHERFKTLETLGGISSWIKQPLIMELPHLRVEIHALDYLRKSALPSGRMDQLLRFGQQRYRLWYQIDGTGILQNVTRNAFGSARPGLIGVMDIGERHIYLHQKGNFECFIMEFSLQPSTQAKCFWNASIEGKHVFDEAERIRFEYLIFETLRSICDKREYWGLKPIGHLLAILSTLFEKKLLTVDECQFPKNKPLHLVQKAQNFLKRHYADLRHQRALAQECGVDINYLNVIFKKSLGKTIYAYLTELRIEQAKHLLETTDFAITDVAAMVGYPGANSFSRVFAKQVHLAPTAYRLKNR